MAVWLPPTPPADGTEDYYVDVALDLAYDTSTTITPAELASVAPYSEEDYDVLGLSRHYPEAEPIKKSQKSYSKQTLKEHINVPPSLFWRRYAIDTLSTKLKKLASHQKKLKAKDQFSPLLEQQPEGPEWSHREDWLLLKGVMEVLEFPLSLAITVPAQMPNWSIIADLISLLSKIRRSPLQCREHLMNVVIPREETNVKGDDTVESKKYKTKDNASKKPKSRKEQKTKNVVIGDNGVEQTSLFTASFDKVLDVTSKRKQASKFTLDSVQKLSTHADLLKEYGIQVDTVLSPMQIAHQRAERIQSELPRHSSQVHQLLAQPYHFSLMRGYAAAAAAAVGAPFMKQSVAGYNLPRQVPGNIAVTTTSVQRFPSVSSTSSSSQLPTNTTIVSQGVLPVSSQFISTSISTSSNSTQPSTPAPLVPAKTFSVASDISKTLRGNITHQQLLLLRQSTLQQQATGNRSQSSTQVARPVIAQPQATPSVQSPTTTIAQKVALPTGIEQLRASLSLPAAPRFPAITSGNSVGRGLTGGRTLQTEDVLALLKQQSLRITATQSFKTGHAVSSQLHSQTPFQFRPESGHLTTKVPSNSNNVVPLDAVKLVSSTNTSTASTTDVVQTQLKAEPTAEQNQSAVGIFAKQQQQVQSQSVAVPFSTPAVSATLSQPTARVTTAAAQNLMKLQQALAQQQQIQKARGSPLPKSTTQ